MADLQDTIKWAEDNNKRWAFTSSNAGSFYFEDFCALSQLDKINWDAVNATDWRNCREEKQAEFLIENCFPWELVERIGVISMEYDRIVNKKLIGATHKPKIQVKPTWYY